MADGRLRRDALARRLSAPSARDAAHAEAMLRLADRRASEETEAALERIKAQSTPSIALEPDQLERFGTFMREKIAIGETSFRRAYLRAVVEAVEVDDHVIRIHGSKTASNRPSSPESKSARAFAVLYANGAP